MRLEHAADDRAQAYEITLKMLAMTTGGEAGDNKDYTEHRHTMDWGMLVRNTYSPKPPEFLTNQSRRGSLQKYCEGLQASLCPWMFLAQKTSCD